MLPADFDAGEAPPPGRQFAPDRRRGATRRYDDRMTIRPQTG
jgi:hypothetical protein